MEIPSRLGKYEIRSLLGRGAMGSVYLAFDPLIERSVAIKILDPAFPGGASEAELGPRFRREAQAAGRLSHPNIVAVHEYSEGIALPDGTDSGSFIAMEFVEGRTLKELFDANTHFSFAEIARIMTELLAALAHAHEKGVVHRDVKPANVMLLANGRVKVADFGVARIEASELTMTGTTLGTIAYMSPEQFMGQPVDGRTDVFSCGVILYRFLAGELPFSGSSTSIIQKLLNQEPMAPSLLNRSVPPAWDPVIKKALAKQASARFQSVAAFADAIRAALAAADDGGTTVVTTPPRAQEPPPPRTRKVLWAAVAAFGAGAVAIAAAVLMGPGEKPVQPAQASASSAATSHAGPATAASAVAAAAPVVDLAAATDKPAAPPPSASAALPEAPAVARAVPSDGEIEQQAWDDALKADSAAAYAAFLREYPKGRFAGRARVKLEALKPKPEVKVAAVAPIPEAAPAPKKAKEEAAAVRPPPAPAVVTPPVVTPPEPAAPAAKAKRAGDTVALASPQAAPPTSQRPSAEPARSKAPAAAASAQAKAPAAAPTANPKTDAADAPKLPADCARPDPGDKRCALVLGNAYRSGRGVEKNDATALSWYRKAAALGDAQAQYEIGLMYFAGQGVRANAAEGVDWVRKGAEQGYAPAQNRLGLAYENSEVSMQPNHVLAVGWFRKGADQGYSSAQSNLGRMYLFGRGVVKDTEAAKAWFQKSANQGNAYGYYHLALMSERGDGVPKNARQASSLYREALAKHAITQSSMLEHANSFVAAHP